MQVVLFRLISNPLLIDLQPYHDYAQSIRAVNKCLNLAQTDVTAKTVSYPILPEFQNSAAFWEDCRLLSFVLLVRETRD